MRFYNYDVTERAGDQDGVSGLPHTYFASFRPVNLIQLQFLLLSNMVNRKLFYKFAVIYVKWSLNSNERLDILFHSIPCFLIGYC